MQTFLPYVDFSDSARVLDMKRLGKQRVETYQIMIAIFEHRGFIHHPVIKMWTGYEQSLLDYQYATVDEWLSRGYRDTCWDKTFALYKQYCGRPRRRYSAPPWVGRVDLHISHQSNLVRKNPEYYGSRFPFTPDDIDYVWPTI